MLILWRLFANIVSLRLQYSSRLGGVTVNNYASRNSKGNPSNLDCHNPSKVVENIYEH